MILTLISLFIIFVGGICLLIQHLKNYDGDDDWGFTGQICIVIGLVFFTFCGGAMSMRETTASCEITKFEAVRQTIIMARESEKISDFEMAAIQHKAVDKNEWLANAKFWTEHPLTNWFWSKRILEIEPIK